MYKVTSILYSASYIFQNVTNFYFLSKILLLVYFGLRSLSVFLE